MSVFNSISVAVLLVLLAAGLITGLSVSGVDILNPQTSAAEANRMDVETDHQEAMYEQQERLAQTQADAQIQTIQREQDMANAQITFDKEMLALEVRNQERWAIAWQQIVVWFGGAFSIIVTLFAVLMTYARVRSMMASAASHLKTESANDVNKEAPQNNYYREYLDLKSLNRDLKHRNDHVAEVNRTLANLCQVLTQEKEELEKEKFDLEEFVKNMKKFREQTKTMKGDYKDNPLAGD